LAGQQLPVEFLMAHANPSPQAYRENLTNTYSTCSVHKTKNAGSSKERMFKTSLTEQHIQTW